MRLTQVSPQSSRRTQSFLRKVDSALSAFSAVNQDLQHVSYDLSTGKYTVNVAPDPGALFTLIHPPCVSTIP